MDHAYECLYLNYARDPIVAPFRIHHNSGPLSITYHSPTRQRGAHLATVTPWVNPKPLPATPLHEKHTVVMLCGQCGRFAVAFVSRAHLPLLLPPLLPRIAEDDGRGGKQLSVFLTKENGMEWWTCVAEGEPTIDLSLVRGGRRGGGGRCALLTKTGTDHALLPAPRRSSPRTASCRTWTATRGRRWRR